ncbi:MAG: hypothetical protein FJ387_02605 [Verrucomicrobia bacterium]|nr:hypothetical protein [Verrucomicrobiota bacterium]
MTDVLECPRWEAVGLVIDQNTRDLLARRYGLLEEIVAWFKAVRLFQDTVDERMILRDPSAADLRQHKTWIASLIAEGERVAAQATAQGGLPPAYHHFTLADVEATVEMLRTDERVWHSPLSPQQKANLIEAVCHVPKS